MSDEVYRRDFLKISTASVAARAGLALAGRQGWAAAQKPNMVVFFTDDQGYADVGCFGSEGLETPNLDRMAREGVRFTDFHASTAVCSASRASLLTGCYAERVGIQGALWSGSRVGINPNEILIPEILKEQGYATAIFGKWHLGHLPKFLPTRHGFDEFFGLPYSSDMWPKHPVKPQDYPPLPLMEGEKTLAYLEDQSLLATWYTDRAVDFIKRNRRRPFFVYLAHSLPHVPLYVSDRFKGRSTKGLYGDVIMEIDWSMGQVLQTLKEEGIDDNTLVVFTSDNGPWLSYGAHAGSAGPLREGKGTMFEGGMREPCIMRWPGKLPPGKVCNELATTMDLLPTFASLAGGKLPKNKIDGYDIWPLMTRPLEAKTPYEVYYCYYDGQLQAVRTPEWKLHFPHAYVSLDGRPGGSGGKPVPYTPKDIGYALFDMKSDIGETIDVAGKHPEVVKRLQVVGEKAREDLGDKSTGRQGAGTRPVGRR